MAEDRPTTTANVSPIDAVDEARKLWLSAEFTSDLKTVERLYRGALSSSKSRARTNTSTNNIGKNESDHPNDKDDDDDDSDDNGNRVKKKPRLHSNLKKSEYKKASEKLALLMCQSGRAKKAKDRLSKLGFKCRLSRSVLDYDEEQYDDADDNDADGNESKKKNKIKKIKPGTTSNADDDADADKNGNKDGSSCPCYILDNYLNQHEIQHLRSVFQSLSANYWVHHNYNIEPPSPYFSYILPLSESSASNKYGFIGKLIHNIYKNKHINSKFPRLKDATQVEMWAHNRPHASGHQLHFDSDDEGRGGVRNPIISTILYITAGCGGPSLVTNQKLTDPHLASKGWLSFPKNERLIAFDGRYLHGVIPGKGVKSGRRVTLMFAFWPEIRIRHGDEPGSARPFPSQKYRNKNHSSRSSEKAVEEWAQKLVLNAPEISQSPSSPDADKTADNNQNSSSSSSSSSYTETNPIEIDRVYESLGGKCWSKSNGLPEYDAVFQGF